MTTSVPAATSASNQKPAIPGPTEGGGFAGSSAAPLRYYGAAPGWKLIDLRELWAYRELGFVLAGREVKIRYRQAVVGVAWVVLQPVIMVLVFRTIFDLIGREPTTAGVPYALTFFCGWLPWQLLSLSMRDGSQTLVTNRQLVTKVYFPRMLLPVASVLCGLLEMVIGLGVLLVLMAWYRFAPASQTPVIVVFAGLSVVLSCGAALWLSALNALYRDIGYVVPFLIQVGFFASPVVYEAGGKVPPDWWWYELNPMVGIIGGFRWSLLGTEIPSLRAIMLAVVVTTVILFSGLWYFRRAEDWIADRI
ncbi:MAG: ABC transporter permease [Planctomycetaceae bacterium]